MANSTKRVSAACIDGRAQSPRYIQQQLIKLHDVLVENATEIREAIRNDSHHTSAEIDVEYFLAVQCVKYQYAQLDVERFIEEEYHLARSIDSPKRVVAAGVVYISPAEHTRLYSIIAPLSTAVAAGNCVVVEVGQEERCPRKLSKLTLQQLKQTLAESNALLRKLLVRALGSDTFAAVESRPNVEDDIWKNCIEVYGTPIDQPPTLNRLISPSLSRTVCVVDRSANIEQAARAVVRARFSFRGRSPYAPDIVLVNEFKRKDFCNAVVQEVTRHFEEGVEMNGNGSASKKGQRGDKGLLQQAREDEGVTELVSSARGSIFSIKDRTSTLLSRKIAEPLLFIHTISSLDDAIDLANSAAEPLLATYLFATPAAAKYLSQFINAHVSCTNDIPADLLVGPASPIGFPVSIQSRYTKEMFSVPRPEFINFPALSHTVAEVLDEGKTDAGRKLREEAQNRLPPSTQRAGKAIGFFEQGLFSGLSVIAVSTLTGVVVLGVYVVPKVVRRMR